LEKDSIIICQANVTDHNHKPNLNKSFFKDWYLQFSIFEIKVWNQSNAGWHIGPFLITDPEFEAKRIHLNFSTFCQVDELGQILP